MQPGAFKVLLTRPAGQADKLSQAIVEAGGEFIHYPVMAISGLDEQADQAIWAQTKQAIIHLDGYQQVIFISSNAVRYGMAWIEQYWPQLPPGIQWHAIGRATAQALSEYGVSCCEPGEAEAMDSEALLRQPSLKSLANAKVLVVRGVGGREFLAEQLRGRGAVVDYAQCYRRSRVNRPVGELDQLIIHEQPDCLVFNSGETLEFACELIKDEKLKALPVVVPGPRVAGLAHQRGFSNIVVASNAGTNAMIAALAGVAEHKK